MPTKSRPIARPFMRPNGLHPRYERLRLMTADTSTAGTPGAGAAGTSGTTATANQTTTDAGNTAGQDAAQATTTATSGTEWDGKVESLPSGAQTLIEKLRKEAGDSRVNAKQSAAAEARDALLKELGLVKDGEAAPDPAKLAQDLTAARDDARLVRVELAVFRTAGTHQADPSALLDSRAFLAKITDLDPTAADFTTKVDVAIKAAISDNPKLLAAQAAGASSVDHAGGSGEGAITAERFAAMTPTEKNALFHSDPALYRKLTGR
ncbi:hypothetical protein ACFWGN_20860 [Oerskovia sp. NPDC060338]|uniref:hypothetical protein n=1 Tax=Oerskovia sp. NPDC060338 TaxID=3347100 RepID=UPI00365800C2